MHLYLKSIRIYKKKKKHLTDNKSKFTSVTLLLWPRLFPLLVCFITTCLLMLLSLQEENGKFRCSYRKLVTLILKAQYSKATKQNLNIYFSIILPTSILWVFHDDSLPACFNACLAACAAGPLPE